MQPCGWHHDEPVSAFCETYALGVGNDPAYVFEIVCGIFCGMLTKQSYEAYLP
jgi:hypothetical protein